MCLEEFLGENEVVYGKERYLTLSSLQTGEWMSLDVSPVKLLMTYKDTLANNADLDEMGHNSPCA